MDAKADAEALKAATEEDEKKQDEFIESIASTVLAPTMLPGQDERDKQPVTLPTSAGSKRSILEEEVVGGRGVGGWGGGQEGFDFCDVSAGWCDV